MITPPKLKAGDKVGIAATAKRTNPEEIAQGIEMLKSWGLQPVLAANIYNEHNFFAGTDKERTDGLQAMLDDPEIKAIVFTKGAYGTLRIINDLVFSQFVEHPKWIAGYSDITALHSYIHHMGIRTIHAVMLQGVPGSLPIAASTLHDALFGLPLEYRVPVHPANCNTVKNVSGNIVGGNLSMVHTCGGTASAIDTTDKILFIEDIDEYLYHLDRMMIALGRTGKLSRLNALVVGGIVGIKESTLPFGQSVEEIILQHTAHYGYPVYFGYPAGHQADNRAIILGSQMNINTENNIVTFSQKL